MADQTKSAFSSVPPAYTHVDQHPVFPTILHDETARYNFLTNLNRYVSTVLRPGNKIAFERRVKPLFMAQTNRDFQSASELNAAMSTEPHYQFWSAMTRSVLEMRQQAGRSLALRQIDGLAQTARHFTRQQPDTLKLDPSVGVPTYMAIVDAHALPGGYSATYVANDVAIAAQYDAGLFAEHAGSQGPLSDGPGRAVAAWLRHNYPNFRPARILDLGSGAGNNTLPLAVGYPGAQVTGLDISPPMLRYSHARAVALNVHNVDFIQADATRLPYPDQSFDWVQTTFLLRETASVVLSEMIREIHRVLKPGGLMLHVESAALTPDVHLFEQCLLDWESRLKNLPFGTVINGMGLKNWMIDGGFSAGQLLQFSATLPADGDILTEPGTGLIPVSGVAWNAFGAWKE